jgi:hypothetical protein
MTTGPASGSVLNRAHWSADDPVDLVDLTAVTSGRWTSVDTIASGQLRAT